MISMDDLGQSVLYWVTLICLQRSIHLHHSCKVGHFQKKIARTNVAYKWQHQQINFGSLALSRHKPKYKHGILGIGHLTK